MASLRFLAVTVLLSLALNGVQGSTLSAQNDPFVTTAAGEHFHLDIPCRFEFVNVITKYEESDLATCHIIISAYNRRARGHFFVGGFDVSIVLHHANARDYLKADGWAHNGDATYEVARSDDGVDWDESEDADIIRDDILRYRLRWNKAAERVTLVSSSCHFDVTFKAGDMVLKPNKDDPPGLVVNVDDDYVHMWAKDGKLVGLPPFQIGQTVGAVVNMFQLSPIQAFIERVFHSNISQTFKTASKQCALISDIVTACNVSRIPNAFKMCSEISTTARYVHCYCGVKGDNDTMSDSILDLFRRCVKAFCEEDVEMCKVVVDEVRDVRTCGYEFYGELKLHTCEFKPEPLSEEAKALIASVRRRK